MLSTLYIMLHITPPYWLRSFLQYALLFGLPALWFIRHQHISRAELHLRRPASIRDILFTVAIALLIQAPLMLLSTLSEMFFHNYTADSMSALLAQPLPLILFSTALCPAFFEELACRGIFLSGYRNTHPLLAALLCGIFFGIIHLNMQQWVYAFFFGFIISLLCMTTGSLFLPMLAHFIINAVQLMTAYYRIPLFPNIGVLAAAVCVSLPLIGWMLHRLWHQHRSHMALAPYQKLTFSNMEPFGIAILVFIGVLFLL